MNKPLSSQAIVIAIVAVVVLLAVVGFLVFKPSLGPGPVVKPNLKMKFPASGGKAPFTPGEAPQGAPSRN